MQVRDAYPIYTAVESQEALVQGAAGGCCFFTGRYMVDEGEKIIDTGLDVDQKPTHGRICISEHAVRQFAQLLGWDVSPDKDDRIANLEIEVEGLQAENAVLREHLTNVTSAAIAGLGLVSGEPEPAVAEPEPEPEPAKPAPKGRARK